MSKLLPKSIGIAVGRWEASTFCRVVDVHALDLFTRFHTPQCLLRDPRVGGKGLLGSPIDRRSIRFVFVEIAGSRPKKNNGKEVDDRWKCRKHWPDFRWKK